MNRWMTTAILATATVALQAQVSDQIRQATMKGSMGASGKCTIEVRVDITAEVDVYGSSGRLRTLAGQPATWTRMECTDPLPYNMSDFRFTGIDGRGKVQLVQDPRNNRGMAVIHIDDPKSGAEGYTFDIEWSGASGGAPTGGFPNTGVSRPGRRGTRAITSEQAIDLCRTEVRAKAERDYNIRNIDITAAAVDTTAGRGDWVTGAFSDRAGFLRRTAAGYRFNCAVDYNAGQVRTVEILPYNQPGYDQTRVIRACQDAVVARTDRNGYEKVRFSSTVVDTSRSGWVSGSITATREPLTDTFDFTCSMDFGSATVRNVDLNPR